MNTRIKHLLSIGALSLLLATENQAGTGTLGLGGGFTYPSSTEEFKKLHERGYNLGGSLTLQSFSAFQITGNVDYHSLDKDWDEITPLVADGGDLKIWTFGLDGRLGAWVPGARMTPYFLAGAGAARITQDDVEANGGVSVANYEDQTKLYYNIGGGLEFNSAQAFGIFVQVKYTRIKAEDEDISMVPVTVGIRF